MSKATKTQQKNRRQERVRAKTKGSETRPRLSVFRSNKFIYAQIINDETGVTVAQASSRELGGSGVEAARKVGAEVAKRAQEKGVAEVVFDRGAYAYMGNVQALAEGAREAGLNF